MHIEIDFNKRCFQFDQSILVAVEIHGPFFNGEKIKRICKEIHIPEYEFLQRVPILFRDSFHEFGSGMTKTYFIARNNYEETMSKFILPEGKRKEIFFAICEGVVPEKKTIKTISFLVNLGLVFTSPLAPTPLGRIVYNLYK